MSKQINLQKIAEIEKQLIRDDPRNCFEIIEQETIKKLLPLLCSDAAQLLKKLVEGYRQQIERGHYEQLRLLQELEEKFK